MPATPNPIIGPMGVVWSPVVQALQTAKQKTAQLAAAKQQGGIFDRYYNCVELSGPNLSQIVSIGATHVHGGVEVGTNDVTNAAAANGAAGRIKQANLAVGTITLSTGSKSATLDSTASGTFTSGQVIGAATAADANAIQPGTTFTISGSTITLSEYPLVSGTALYCAACNWEAT